VAALTATAALLDTEVVPALLAQYGLTYRSLLKRAPAADVAVDDLEAALPA